MTAQACLTELDLSDNAFGPVGVEALVGFLTSSSCFTLKVARFNNNGLGIKGGTVYQYICIIITLNHLCILLIGRNFFTHLYHMVFLSKVDPNYTPVL